jgi:hypothetical protein
MCNWFDDIFKERKIEFNFISDPSSTACDL